MGTVLRRTEVEEEEAKNLYMIEFRIQTDMQSHRFGQYIEYIWKIVYLLFK